MDVNRYEQLLGIKVPEAQVPTVAARLSAAAVYVNTVCGNQFTQPDGMGGVVLTFPLDVELGVAKLAQAMADTGDVASFSIEGMSKSFFQSGGFLGAKAYWKRYIMQKVRYY